MPVNGSCHEGGPGIHWMPSPLFNHCAVVAEENLMLGSENPSERSICPRKLIPQAPG